MKIDQLMLNVLKEFSIYLTPLTSGCGISPQPNTYTKFYIAGES